MTEKTGFIYVIKFAVDGKCLYVGQTRQKPEERWRKHWKDKTRVGKALNHVGYREAFDFSVIEEVPVSALNEREQYWIGELGTLHPAGLNMMIGGGGYRETTPDWLQKRLSAAAKSVWRRPDYAAKQKAASKERWADPAFRERAVASMRKRSSAVSEQNRARWADPEYRKRMQENARKQWADPEHRKRMSQLAKAQRAREEAARC